MRIMRHYWLLTYRNYWYIKVKIWTHATNESMTFCRKVQSSCAYGDGNSKRNLCDWFGILAVSVFSPSLADSSFTGFFISSFPPSVVLTSKLLSSFSMASSLFEFAKSLSFAASAPFGSSAVLFASESSAGLSVIPFAAK